jgi:putative membrane protein insertion efficiency factor
VSAAPTEGRAATNASASADAPPASAGRRALPVTPAAAPRERLHIRVALAPIRLYQRVISPALPRRCKYHPTCSAYAVQAIRSYGILRGSVLAAWRLLRCNPFSHGGYDPVSSQTLFRSPPRSHSASASHS